jgi:hypothetical protein
MQYKTLIITFLLLLGSFSVVSSQEILQVKGWVTDSLGQPLENVNILVKNSKSGSISDERGTFSILISPPFPVALQFSSIGYEPQEIVLQNETQTQNFKVVLLPKSEQISEVNIEGQRTNSSFNKIDPNLSTLLPDASGGSIEALVKSQMGVSSNNELSSQYRVRGGNFDENLVYVNGIEIYRPFLIRAGQQEGLSFVNPSLVSAVQFSSGGFNAQYGDKMSSVLDIDYKRPSAFAGSAQLSFLGAGAHVEGSSKNKKLSYITGIRYKTNKYLLGTLDVSGDYKPSFFDGQTFISYKLSPTWNIEAMGYYSRNSYQFVPENRETVFGTISEVKKLKIYFEGQEQDLFQTGFASAAFSHSRNSNNQYKLIASGFRTYEEETYDILGQYWLQELEALPGQEVDPEKGITNIGVGSYLQHARNDLLGIVQNVAAQGKHRFNNHLLTWELKYQHERFSDNINEWELKDSAGYSIPINPDKLELAYALNMNLDISSHRLTSYIQDEYEWKTIHGDFFFNYGIRTNYWSFNNEFLFSPRMNVSFLPANHRNFRLRGAFGWYYQSPFYKELRLPNGTLNSDIKAQKSVHYLLGGDWYFTVRERPFKFTTEAYYKHLTNLIPYQIDNVRIRYQGKNNATGYATGLDMKINGEFVKGIESWASLSLLKTEEDILDDSYTVTDENGASKTIHPGYIPRPSDQRLNFSLFFQDYLPNNPSFKVHLNLLFGTGLPFGPPRSPRHQATFRMPSYRRVDMGFSKEVTGAHKRQASLPQSATFKSVWLGLEIFNLLDIHNTISYYWVSDVSNRQYAVPNYLTSRRINLKLTAEF